MESALPENCCLDDDDASWVWGICDRSWENLGWEEGKGVEEARDECGWMDALDGLKVKQAPWGGATKEGRERGKTDRVEHSPGGGTAGGKRSVVAVCGRGSGKCEKCGDAIDLPRKSATRCASHPLGLPVVPLSSRRALGMLLSET